VSRAWRMSGQWGERRVVAGLATAGLCLAAAPASRAGDFATRVLAYAPAPGQFVNDPDFNDPLRALGPPVGGGVGQADNTKVVTLGGFGGSITLGFDAPVLDDARNPLGLDLIVFSNAFWSGGPNVRSAEPGVVEVSVDADGNGLADDAWFVLPGSSLSDPVAALRTQAWDDDPGTATPPSNLLWYPIGAPSSFETTGFELPPALCVSSPPYLLENPDGADASAHVFFGYADLSPTLLPGDLSGATGGSGDDSLSDPEDAPGLDPAFFYTAPDDPVGVGVDAGSGGGDALDIADAVDPATGQPAGLDRIDFVRISTGCDVIRGVLGEVSTEISAVADVRAPGDLDGDDRIGPADLSILLSAWGRGDPRADLTRDGFVNAADLSVMLSGWGEAE